MSDKTISVIGGGSWGTALAHLLSKKDHRVKLWVLEEEVAEQISKYRENSAYLPGVPLEPSLQASPVLEEVVRETDLLLFVVPTPYARSVLSKIAPLLSRPLPVISATKGIETDSLCLVTDIMKQTLPLSFHEKFGVLSGPSFAREVSRGQPTAVSLSSSDLQLAKSLQPVFSTQTFRVYTNTDPIGTQIGGALKNVIAIAAGVVDGLELGLNSRAALITRGLAEMTRLGVAMGGKQETFFGLSGLGDLILTCTGDLSRNHHVGMELGRGHSLETILREMHMVAEGVRTTQAAFRLAEKYEVRMPIVSQVHAVLFEGKDPHKSVHGLLESTAGEETGVV